MLIRETKMTHPLEHRIYAPDSEYGERLQGNEIKHLMNLLEKTFKRPAYYSHTMSREEIAEREGQQQVMSFIRKHVRV